MLAIAATAWLLLHEAVHSRSRAIQNGVIFNPGYQHSQRLRVAAARAAMDVLGMTGSGDAAHYAADYHLQRMQIRADAIGLERWAPHDKRHHGLIDEIQASIQELDRALDQAETHAQHGTEITGPGSKVGSTPEGRVPLLAAVNRAESAFSNYAASLTEPENLRSGGYLFTFPVLLWWLLVLLWVELIALAWVVFTVRKRGSI